MSQLTPAQLREVIAGLARDWLEMKHRESEEYATSRAERDYDRQRAIDEVTKRLDGLDIKESEYIEGWPA